jgi:hypothetical protein
MSISELIKEIRQRKATANNANSANNQRVKVSGLATLAISDSKNLSIKFEPDPHDNVIALDFYNFKLKPVPTDNRRYCFQCFNLLRSGQCLSAQRGELPHTSKIYRPVTDILRNCESYLPRIIGINEQLELDEQPQPFSDFFNKTKQVGIELLADDKKWLQSLGYFCLNAELLERYIQCWLDAMNNEKIEFKKQNKGRFAANTFIRESIKNDN